jgi:hypothetical protein
VKVREPVWTMTRLCPVCEQGSCLAFVACPSCGRIIIRCEEEGSVFLDPRNLASRSFARTDADVCPSCTGRSIAEFSPASDAAIRAAGFSTAEFA